MFYKKMISSLTCFFLSVNIYASTNTLKPTLILVHGALLTSSAWMSVQSYLQTHGYNVVTVDLPGRADDDIPASDVSIYSSAEKLCQVAELQQGQVVLVGHSQGGAVITQATHRCGSKIKALVYVAAVIPLNGEKAFDMLNDEDGRNFDKCATLDKNTGLYKINYDGPLKEMFMDDATTEQARRAINNMTAEPVRIGDEVLKYNEKIFSMIPKFYIETTDDKIISFATQKNIQSKVQLKKIYTMKTGHSPFVSQPKKLGGYLTEIVDFVSS